MRKRTLNIAAVCVVVLGVASVYSIANRKATNEKTNNISIDGTVVAGDNQTAINEYQENIIAAVTKQQLETFEKLTKTLEKNEKDSLTDLVAKDVFKGYLQYNSSGDLKAEDLIAITEANIKDQSVTRSTISAQNLKYTKFSTDNLKVYGNQVAKIQDGLAKAFLSIDPKKITSKHVAALYMTTANLLLRQPVPEGVGLYHLNLINAYRDYAVAFGLIELQVKDPARALLGVELARQSNDLLIQNFDSIRSVMIKNKIVYTETDPAYKWINPPEGSTIITTQ